MVCKAGIFLKRQGAGEGRRSGKEEPEVVPEGVWRRSGGLETSSNNRFIPHSTIFNLYNEVLETHIAKARIIDSLRDGDGCASVLSRRMSR